MAGPCTGLHGVWCSLGNRKHSILRSSGFPVFQPDYTSVSHRINRALACFLQTGCFQSFSCSADCGRYHGCYRFYFRHVIYSLLFQPANLSNVENVWNRCSYLVMRLEHNRVPNTTIIFNGAVYGLVACMAHDYIYRLPVNLIYIPGFHTSCIQFERGFSLFCYYQWSYGGIYSLYNGFAVFAADILQQTIP